ncbi:TetR/AcrR family transcriptional regulator [Streptomyces sp. NPDC002888]|uniref:TetR/AcrR family transcriptional regulator n=1 Tax=Streptomyces sp. NPDC002888 TaxID=3364668 RepID=UPI0036750870
MNEPVQRVGTGTRAATRVRDGRLLRGVRSRQVVARRAADVASVEGLNGLSIGRLAADLGLSKSGVQTLFGTKERLQVAAVEFAQQAFVEAVVRPASAAEPGAARLRSLVEHWIAYAETPLFPGGCFWAANLADFDSRPGVVRDALAAHHRDWLGLLAGEFREAARAGETAPLNAELTAFQLDAVLTAANIALRMGDTDAPAKVRQVLTELLTPPA